METEIGKTEFDLNASLDELEKRISGQDKGTEKVSQSEKLIKIAEGYKLFHDDTKEAYAYINNVAVKIRGSMFKQLLARELWELENKSPNSDALNQALNVIEAMAVYDGECIKLSNRVAEHNGCFYYDLADGRAVRITKDGWDVIDNFPILFKRYSHQQRQV